MSRTIARVESVDGYLAAVPARARIALAKLRRAIRAAAPQATEVISYRIPTFRHRGGLVAFAAFDGHCTFFVMSTKVMRAHAAALRGYPTGKGSIRFSADKPLPTALVTKLVKARIAENERHR
ncbi:MAG: iron chaperone [Gemmatimonadales bacterium]